ncbi:dihydroorotase [Alkalithermobacter thermoalcaliphilus JW-YL-7 = DSM 7308]|uniref:Dihydroorotase n=1 Tax=Alkalithermobacter thermoalcaliphilus JW-YL-7 = DSM 7308 TaxID=1121328 RepID=A0A150FNE0_CLOPD|nr:Dihydroorotase [[Clostridium] paradoxum JW-YL-7 = DSM 7308]SHK89773.1 dihydroorotase [[Clostridium] paradoxum JW-YL-7 = DSM 7308]
MNLLIKNANIMDVSKNIISDILIENGKISRIDKNIISKYKSIDAKGLTLIPSFIDMHTHLRTPGYEYKEDLESGQKAALKGGYTTLCAMANTNPVCDNEKVINLINEKVKRLNLCDVIQVSSVTKNLDGVETVDFDKMVKHTKLFSDDGKTIENEDIMKKALKLSKDMNFKILTHCDPESEIVRRDLEILENTGGNLHICHISLKSTLDTIKEFKDKNIKFTCEVTPHHIFKSNLDYKVNPSFATTEDVSALIQGIKDGYIDVIATDHAPHSMEDKKNNAPGISNIEVAFSMVYKVFKDNGIPINKLIEMMSYNPAKILGLNSGVISEGYKADLVLVDLHEKYTIDVNSFISKGKNNPFDGYEVCGKVKMTIKGGEILYDNR